MNKLLYILLLLISACTLWGQSTSNLPYSRFGLGTIADPSLYHLRASGSLSASYNSPYYINTGNAASYSHLRATAFDVGAFAQSTRLSTQTKNNNQWSGNLEYFALAIPLYNPINGLLNKEQKDYNLGLGVSLRPFSNNSYNIAVADSLDNIGTIFRSIQGEGNVNILASGLSGKYKNFSIGTHLNYYFGNTDISRRTVFVDHPNAYNNEFRQSYSLSGFSMDFGAMYTLQLNKDEIKKDKQAKAKSLNFGINYELGTNFNTVSDTIYLARQGTSTNPSNIDTLNATYGSKNSGRLPGKFNIGVNYSHDRHWMLGLDYETRDWSTFSNGATGIKSGSMLSAYKISGGGYYRPKFDSYSNYFNRVYYRAGFLYETDGRKVNETQMDRMALTLGFGLPFSFQRKFSYANLGIELGRRGRNAKIKEDYIKFTLSFNFSDDEWFVKSKYN